MTGRTLAMFAITLTLARPTELRAQKASISLAGGIAAPVGTLSDRSDAGFNLAAALSVSAPLMPIGVRLEAGLNAFDGRSANDIIATTSTRILSATMNATLALGRLNSSPYLIGGVGAYNRRFSSDAISGTDRTSGGFNAGAGVRFPLGTLSTFVEARYHQMLGNAADGMDYRYIPITFGINF